MSRRAGALAGTSLAGATWLVACGGGSAHVDAEEPARSVIAAEPERADGEASEPAPTSAPASEAAPTETGDPMQSLGLEDAPHAPAPVPTVSTSGTGGGGVGEGCIQLATTCAARGGFGDRPRWCRDRDAAHASVPGRIEVVSVTGRGAEALAPLVASELRPVAQCHREAIAASPARAVGEVVVAVRVEGPCLRHARLVSSTVHDPHLAECIVGVLDGASAGSPAIEGPARLRLRLTLE